MACAVDVLNLGFVQNGISYAQTLAIAILAAKVTFEAIQTYIMYQGGDPDADPGGLLVRTAQATAIIMSAPWLVNEIFTFGSKVADDVASMSVTAGNEDWGAVLTSLFQIAITGNGAMMLIIFLIIALVIILLIAVQATIRGGELALMAVIAPIMALNISSTNKSMWSAWIKEMFVICIGQALQLFLLKGALALVTVDISKIYLLVGWLWVTFKSPKFVKQFIYSSGFTGTTVGGAKQFGSQMISMKMMRSLK